jgi:anti-sigma-K factor RskA
MNDRMHIAEEDLTLYAMGTLPAAEMAAIQAHVDQCARCTEEVRQTTLALAAYAQCTPQAELAAGVRERFLSRLAVTPQTATLAQRAEAVAEVRPAVRNSVAVKERSSWLDLFGRWSPLLVGGMAVALLLLGVDDMNKRGELEPLVRQARHGAADSAQLAQMMDLLTSPEVKRVALHEGTRTAPPPEGRVVYADRTGKLLLTAENLKPLPEGKVYELWILQPGGKKPMPAGTFAPDQSGTATMMVANAPEGLAVQGFGVTIEKAGGSDTPTLPIVLSGL